MPRIFKFRMPDRPGDLGVKGKVYDVIDIHLSSLDRYRYITEKKTLIRLNGTYRVGFPEKIVPENSDEYRMVVAQILAAELTDG